MKDKYHCLLLTALAPHVAEKPVMRDKADENDTLTFIKSE